MASVTFTGLTLQQALVFADWFEGQGEQDCYVWFDDRQVKPPKVAVHNALWKKIDNDKVIVKCE